MKTYSPLRRYDIEHLSAIDTDVLETIPFDYPESSTKVVYETNEFTSVCPWTGLPDFGNLVITYHPEKFLVELKSLKYYLTSFRNIGILQEHAVNQILKDLVTIIEPKSITVEISFNERGGLSTNAFSQYPAS
jgi:7-cyano-7-deazaguanine reductase